MNNYSLTIDSISYGFDDKKNKKLKTNLFSRLCKKLENESNQEIDELIKITFECFRELVSNEDVKPKKYKQALAILRKRVREIYNYTAKNELKEQYTATGLAVGVAIGASFTTINPAMIGIGLPIGLAIGVSIGQKKEKEAEEKGNLY